MNASARAAIVLAARVADDQVGDVVVAHRDEVGPGRVERIGEDAGFADQRPAVGGEHARAAVREVLQREKVLELAGVRLHDVGALRLELAQPVERALEPVDAR